MISAPRAPFSARGPFSGSLTKFVRLLSALLIIAGALLLAAGIYIYQPPRPYLDLHRAGSPLIDVPATGQETHQVLKLHIPDDPAWMALERNLGQPHFFIGGVGFQNKVLCAETMKLAVTLSSAGRPIPLQKGHFPYAYSSTDCKDIGFDFSARNGEHVEIEISTRFEEPTAFDIEVVPLWPKPIKDAGVGVALEPLFRRVFWALITTGAVLLAAGVIILIVRRNRGNSSIAS